MGAFNTSHFCMVVFVNVKELINTELTWIRSFMAHLLSLVTVCACTIQTLYIRLNNRWSLVPMYQLFDTAVVWGMSLVYKLDAYLLTKPVIHLFHDVFYLNFKFKLELQNVPMLLFHRVFFCVR